MSSLWTNTFSLTVLLLTYSRRDPRILPVTEIVVKYQSNAMTICKLYVYLISPSVCPDLEEKKANAICRS
jgi:hypothetical protein